MRLGQFPELMVCAELGLVSFRIGGREVLLEEQDLRRLLCLPDATRISTMRSGKQVVPAVAHRSWGYAGIGRLIVEAGRSEVLGYRDGDSFNLTRANLVVVRLSGRQFRRTRPTPTLSH